MNKTKDIASNLGVQRLRPRQPTVSSKISAATPTVRNCLPTVTGIPVRITPRASRPTNSDGPSSPSISDQARRQSVAASRIDGAQSTQQTRRTSQHVQIVTTQLPSTTTSNVRHNGQCIKCLRVLSLTAAGLLHSHGHGCPGSGQLPIPRSVQNVVPKQSGTAASSDTTIPSSYAAQSQSPEDIMEMLRQRRCRVLKRVPKASRIPAAEKLSETLRKVVVNPESVSSWSDLMSFTFACFGVPGHRGGKRHLSSLVSKVNQAIASFPTMSVSPVQNGIKPPKVECSAMISRRGRQASLRKATFGEPFDWRQAMTLCHRSMTSRQQHCVRNIQSARKRVQLRCHPLVKTVSPCSNPTFLELSSLSCLDRPADQMVYAHST